MRAKLIKIGLIVLAVLAVVSLIGLIPLGGRSMYLRLIEAMRTEDEKADRLARLAEAKLRRQNDKIEAQIRQYHDDAAKADAEKIRQLARDEKQRQQWLNDLAKRIGLTVLVVLFALAPAYARAQDVCTPIARGTKAPFSGDLCNPVFVVTLGVKFDRCREDVKRLVQAEIERCKVQLTAKQSIFDAKDSASQAKIKLLLGQQKPPTWWSKNQTWVLTTTALVLGVLVGGFIGAKAKGSL